MSIFVKSCFLTIFIFFGISITATFAQKRTGTKKVGVKSPASVRTLLWEISGNGLQKPSYVFGTMHILCADDAKLSPNMKKALQEAVRVYLEIDMDDREQMMSSLKYFRMNEGVKLQDLLTPAEYKRIDSALKKSKTPMPLSMMNRFKPMLIASMLGEQFMDCAKKNGMEMVIMDEVKSMEKEIRGLETIAYQAGLFDSIPYAKQAKDLLLYIDSAQSYKNTTMEMVKVYKAQDLAKMDSLTRKSDPGMEAFMDILLYRRNRNWVQQMPVLMREGTMVFAVGAGHLPGKEGVLQLLRDKGYVVKPVVN